MPNNVEDLPEEAIVKMESRLFKTYAQFGAIIDSSDDAIVSMDLSNRVKIWNKAAERIYGYTAIEIVGENIKILWPDDRLAEVDSLTNKVVNREAVKNFETAHKTKDGKMIFVSMTLSPILDDKDQITGISMISRDITEQKMTQEKLSRYDEFERLNKLMVDREVKMAELKNRVRELEEKLKYSDDNSRPSSPTP